MKSWITDSQGRLLGDAFRNELSAAAGYRTVVLFHYLLLVVSVSGNFLIRSDKCVANFPYYVALMWAPEAKSSSIHIGVGGAPKQDPSRNYSATNYRQFRQIWNVQIMQISFDHSQKWLCRDFTKQTICMKLELEFMTGQFFYHIWLSFICYSIQPVSLSSKRA